MTIGALVAIPELQAEGLARVEGERGGFSSIRFLASGAAMTQEDHACHRHALLPGTRIAVGDRSGVVGLRRLTRDAAGLLVYGVDFPEGEEPVREDAITAVPLPEDALNQLLTVHFQDLRPPRSRQASGPEAWAALTLASREALLAWRDSAATSTHGVIGLASARVTPLPHQLLAAQRVLGDRQVRVLLADEVGLGKTIEAGLILQSLAALTPGMRVLVIAPGALTSQWFLELHTRFGGRTPLLLDAERIAGFTGNPWQDHPWVIASAQAIEELSGKEALRFAAAKWDAVVVDECHRMAPGGSLYARVAILSKNAPSLLLLSATPPRAHADAALALLALLQPTRWKPSDLAAFTARQALGDRLADLVRRTREAAPGSLAEAWAELQDPLATALAQRRDAAGVEALLAYARDHLDPDRRVVRNRRAHLERLAEATGVRAFAATTRTREFLTYRPDEREAAVLEAFDAYRRTLVASKRSVPPRLAHWLATVALALAAHPQVATRMLAMRAQVLADPDAVQSYRARARPGETLAQVLRSDLSENEINRHIAVSAACHADPGLESPALAALRATVEAWDSARSGTARLAALAKRLKAFWKENPDEKVLVFTGHTLGVLPLAEALGAAFGEDAVATFGAHQEPPEREDAARRFQKQVGCRILVCDPLGGEGRNFQFVSLVVHHDLPWSLAAVEQRIGRVDRLGRDGEVPSLVLVAAGGLDEAWSTCLDQAVGVFTASTAGLEFIAPLVETRALDAVLSGGVPALSALVPDLVQAVADERADVVDDSAFAASAEAYRTAASQARAAAQQEAPTGAVARWIRHQGGDVRREDEHPRAWRLRARLHDQPVSGIYDRETALAHPHLAFLGIGHRLIDAQVADAAAATWCRASAWRRRKGPLPSWSGLRIVATLDPDLTPLMTAGLRLDVARRLYACVPPVRLTLAASAAQVVDEGTPLHAAATAAFGLEGDGPVSAQAPRDAWTRPLVAGEVAKVTSWQDELRRAATHLRGTLDTRLEAHRAAWRQALDAALLPGLEAVRAVATATAAALGPDHPDTLQAVSEAADEERQVTALQAAVGQAVFTWESASFVALV